MKLDETQCLWLVGIEEDLAFCDRSGEGPDVAKVKEAIKDVLERGVPTPRSPLPVSLAEGSRGELHESGQQIVETVSQAFCLI